MWSWILSFFVRSVLIILIVAVVRLVSGRATSSDVGVVVNSCGFQQNYGPGRSGSQNHETKGAPRDLHTHKSSAQRRKKQPPSEYDQVLIQALGSGGA